MNSMTEIGRDILSVRQLGQSDTAKPLDNHNPLLFSEDELHLVASAYFLCVVQNAEIRMTR